MSLYDVTRDGRCANLESQHMLCRMSSALSWSLLPASPSRTCDTDGMVSSLLGVVAQDQLEREAEGTLARKMKCQA